MTFEEKPTRWQTSGENNAHRLVAGHCKCGGTHDCPWKETSFASIPAIPGMKLFFISFGSGSIFRNYYAAFMAREENIVRAFMNKRYHGLWSSVYYEPPRGLKPLQADPEALHYARMEDV